MIDVYSDNYSKHVTVVKMQLLLMLNEDVGESFVPWDILISAFSHCPAICKKYKKYYYLL